MRRDTFVWSTGGMLIAGLDSQGLTLAFTLCALAASMAACCKLLVTCTLHHWLWHAQCWPELPGPHAAFRQSLARCLAGYTECAGLHTQTSACW